MSPFIATADLDAPDLGDWLSDGARWIGRGVVAAGRAVGGAIADAARYLVDGFVDALETLADRAVDALKDPGNWAIVAGAVVGCIGTAAVGCGPALVLAGKAVAVRELNKLGKDGWDALTREAQDRLIQAAEQRGGAAFGRAAQAVARAAEADPRFQELQRALAAADNSLRQAAAYSAATYWLHNVIRIPASDRAFSQRALNAVFPLYLRATLPRGIFDERLLDVAARDLTMNALYNERQALAAEAVRQEREAAYAPAFMAGRAAEAERQERAVAHAPVARAGDARAAAALPVAPAAERRAPPKKAAARPAPAAPAQAPAAPPKKAAARVAAPAGEPAPGQGWSPAAQGQDPPPAPPTDEVGPGFGTFLAVTIGLGLVAHAVVS